MRDFPVETSEYDVYCTACPKCHAIQGGNDWPPLRHEKFKCEYCGHEYTTDDLLEDEHGTDGVFNKLLRDRCPYYIVARVESWGEE